MKRRFVFVSVVFNNYYDTLDFCRSLRQMRIGNDGLSCFLVDNSTSGETQEQIDSLGVEFPFVTVLRPESNVGYFGGFNYFLDNETVAANDVVVLCNNDLVFDREFCGLFLAKRYSEDVYVVCPDVITADGVHQNPHVIVPWGRAARLKLDLYFTHYYVASFLRSIQRLLKFFWNPKRRKEPSAACYLHMGIGACYILLPVFFEKFARLEYPHFLYGEEAYLTKQVHSVGGRLYYDPVLKVLHKESATLSKLPSRMTYQFGRDGYWHYRKYY